MLRIVGAFVFGISVGAAAMAAGAPARQTGSAAPAVTNVAQLRLYTIDRGRLDDFSAAWYGGVYPLRLKMGYQIPFAAKIPSTNQFVWLLTYSGPQSWDQKEKEYYGSAARKGLSPDPAQWIARPDELMVTPVVGLSAGPPAASR